MRTLLRDLKDWKLQDADKDIRGWTLKSLDGQRLGRIDGMIADTDKREIDAIVLDNSREFSIRDIEIRDGEVLLRSGTGSPAASGAARTGSVERGTQESIRVPVVEERVDVGKRTVTKGGVHVHSDVKEKPVEEKVSLKDTDVHVERHKADRPATEGDIRAAADRDIEMLETTEEPVVERSARVVEEVVVSKDVDQKTETIHEKARRSEVDVEDVGSKRDRSRRH